MIKIFVPLKCFTVQWTDDINVNAYCDVRQLTCASVSNIATFFYKTLSVFKSNYSEIKSFKIAA